MKAKLKTTPEQELFAIAEAQQGLFTARQAIEVGFDKKNHSYHVKVGNWKRAHRGIYQLVRYPISNDSEYALWSLWSCDKNGGPQGVFSYDTALSINELSDLNPSKMHMTVPPSFRRREIPEILVLHKGELKPQEIEERSGFRITKPLRAIVDLLLANSVSRDFLIQALTEGLQRGLISQREIEKAHLNDTERTLLGELQREVET
jgi:predicted transcriptional regulator of viral defense system